MYQHKLRRGTNRLTVHSERAQAMLAMNQSSLLALTQLLVQWQCVASLPWLKDHAIQSVGQLMTGAHLLCLATCPLEQRDAKATLLRALQSPLVTAPQEQALAISCQGRPDAPTSKHHGRGNLKRALEAAAPANRDAARARLANDLFAQSNVESRESRWNTWCKIATAWGLSLIHI